MSFDPTITLGALLNLAGIVGVGLVYLIRMEGKLNLMTLRIGNLEKTVQQMNDVNARIGVLEERLKNHVAMLTVAIRDISDLRRGNGFIASPRERVDGEYP
jgi:hypothetical protein